MFTFYFLFAACVIIIDIIIDIIIIIIVSVKFLSIFLLLSPFLQLSATVF